MQFRRVDTAEVEAVTKSYDPTDGWAKDELLQVLTLSWTNNSPVAQWIYGMATKGGCRVTLQCRSRGYLSTSHGFSVDGDPDDVEIVEVSRFGVGADVGNGGILAIGGAYGINELRQNSTSVEFMPHLTGDFLVAAGETFNARIEIRFVSEFWENTSIDGGDNDTEATVVAGGLRLDLFATPTVATPRGRSTPTIVGVSYDREIDLGIADTRTEVNMPTGVAAGDVLLAIVVNQLGLDTDIQPVETGWTLIHNRNEGLLGIADVHMKIFARTATGSEPATYSFENALFAEEISVIMALRDAVPFGSVEGQNWYVASNLARFEIVEKQIAPSIARGGQLMLAVSYFAHALWQSPITQTPPVGMTEVVDIPGSGCTLAIAMLEAPPNPTREREFIPSQVPFLISGHSITAAILVPGEQTF